MLTCTIIFTYQLAYTLKNSSNTNQIRSGTTQYWETFLFKLTLKYRIYEAFTFTTLIAGDRRQHVFTTSQRCVIQIIHPGQRTSRHHCLVIVMEDWYWIKLWCAKKELMSLWKKVQQVWKQFHIWFFKKVHHRMESEMIPAHCYHWNNPEITPEKLMVR